MAEELLLTDEELCKDCHALEWRETTWASWCKEGKCKGYEERKAAAQAQLAEARRLRLDRPDREKAILDVLVQNCPFVDGCQRQCTPTDQEDCYSHFTKPLLALMPTEEEIRKQERERILYGLEECMAGLALDHPEYYKNQEFVVMPLKNWKALKEKG